MSGPKISIYELDEHGRNIVFEQVYCDSTSLAYAEQIRTLLKEIPSLKSQMDSSISIIEKICNDENYKKESIEKIRTVQMSLSQKLDDVKKKFEKNTPKPSAKYYITDEAVAEKRKQLNIISSIREEILKIKESVDESIDLGNKAFKEKENITTETIIEYLATSEDNGDGIDIENVAEVRERISNDISGIISFEVPEPDTKTNIEQLKSAYQKRLLHLKGLQLSQELLFDIDTSLSQMSQMQDEDRLRTFGSITVKGLIKKCEDYFEEQKRLKEELDELRNNYIALCNMLGIETTRVSDFQNTEEIKDAINVLEKEFVKTQEQKYISECLDSVMSEMGYNVIGNREVTKKNGTHFRNELFTYGDGTAVNVTYSADGKIAMELGGLDNTDRLPNEQETAELCHQMESFCVDFKEIEKRLAAKGVILADRISLLPPNPEYAQIINTDDYNMTGEAENLQVKKRQVGTSAGKTMKVDN